MLAAKKWPLERNIDDSYHSTHQKKKAIMEDKKYHIMLIILYYQKYKKIWKNPQNTKKYIKQKKPKKMLFSYLPYRPPKFVVLFVYDVLCIYVSYEIIASCYKSKFPKINNGHISAS